MTSDRPPKWSRAGNGPAWWRIRAKYDLVTSNAVLDELEGGDYPGKADAQVLVEKVILVPVVDEIDGILSAYTEHKLMPRNPLGDALHLALASYHKCDYLLTWNCQNLANPNKFAHIRIVNSLLRLSVPELVTPYQLLEISR
jgi:predicted nucleic acid-binding protein